MPWERTPAGRCSGGSGEPLAPSEPTEGERWMTLAGLVAAIVCESTEGERWITRAGLAAIGAVRSACMNFCVSATGSSAAPPAACEPTEGERWMVLAGGSGVDEGRSRPPTG